LNGLTCSASFLLIKSTVDTRTGHDYIKGVITY
jgi:hypothetical protein